MFRKVLFVLLIFLTRFQAFSQPVTNIGTDFWVAFQHNWDVPTYYIVINSGYTCTGNVSALYSSYSQDFTVNPGVATVLTVPKFLCLQQGKTNKGIHVVTDHPVSVACINFSDLPLSTDGYLALPSESLGTDYYIMSYYGDSYSGLGMLGVIATHDGTHVTIYNMATGQTDNIILGRGEAYQADAISNDITGSRIQSDYPVAVFGSNANSTIPPTCNAGDCIIEQMMPTQTWGKEFFTVSLGGRQTDIDLFRILAKDNFTTIKINGTQVATINGSEFYETELSGKNIIEASKPVTVMQYAKSADCAGSNGRGDPFMMLVPPKQQYAMQFRMGVVPIFLHYVNIVASPNALGNIYEDGALIPVSLFSEIGSSGYYGAQVAITTESHSFTGAAPFEVWSYGWAGYNSYGYPMGGSLSPLANVASITLTPDSALGYLNITNMCFTATVTDVFNAPLKGIMVDFKIHGMGDILDNLFTDSLGQAHFCYTRTGTVPGMDSIYAEVSTLRSTTSRGYWITCAEPSDGGTIGYSQSGCDTFPASPVISLDPPAGFSGDLEYMWQMSITDGSTGFSDMPGSNTPGYSPGLITQSTWYRRLSRVTCTAGWPAEGISNVVEMLIGNQFTPGITLIPTANPYCEGTPVTVNATGLNGGPDPSYQWILNGAPAGTDTSAFSWIPSPDDSIRCIFTSSLTCVTVNPVSSATVIMTPDQSLPAGISISASPNPFCPGKEVTLTAVPVNGGMEPAYEWSVNGVIQGPDSASWSYYPSGNDLINCRLTSNLYCVSGNPVVSPSVILIERAPDAKFSVTPVDTIISHAIITFTDESTGATGCMIDWGDGTITGCDSIFHTYTSTGTFSIKVVVENDAGCSDSAFATVLIRPEYSIYIPNAFTPDGDGLNDAFRLVYAGIENFSLRIYDRYGQEIFSGNDPLTGWDGQYKGQPCPEGTYVYKIIFIDTATGLQRVFSGTVVLLRTR
jgi:gliding motility-associated-like protein